MAAISGELLVNRHDLYRLDPAYVLVAAMEVVVLVVVSAIAGTPKYQTGLFAAGGGQHCEQNKPRTSVGPASLLPRRRRRLFWTVGKRSQLAHETSASMDKRCCACICTVDGLKLDYFNKWTNRWY
jgi:hypothetical protein